MHHGWRTKELMAHSVILCRILLRQPSARKPCPTAPRQIELAGRTCRHVIGSQSTATREGCAAQQCRAGESHQMLPSAHLLSWHLRQRQQHAVQLCQVSSCQAVQRHAWGQGDAGKG